MLLSNEARDVTKSGVLETARATIKTSPKIFSFFADQTYANKPRAICRELAANAVDSHVMAGKADEPIEVWLPTLIDPVFKVRDFGLGMSHEFVMGPFMSYADGSTKDQSNIAIGGFGIGSKSPFAYVDQFTIKSVFDGTMSVYSVFKDEDGIPSISLLAQKSTDEPNGVEVSFPVEPEDFVNFQEAAFEALKYFDPLPIVRGAGGKTLEAPTYAAKGKNWGMRDKAGPLQVIMGGVMYPVDAENLSHKFKDETARRMLTYGLDIKVPIGSCSIALSREQLSYDDRTIEGLTKACLSVVSEVSQSFSTMFDSYPSLWDAKVALYDEVYPNGYRHYGGQSIRGKFLSEHAQYKGQPLAIDHMLLVSGGVTVWDLEPASYRRGGKTPNPKWEHYEKGEYKVIPGGFDAIIIDDLPQSPKSKAVMKIKELLGTLKQEKRTLILRLYDAEKQTAKDIITALGNPSDYTLTSTLPEPAVGTVMTKAGTIRPKVRMFTYDGVKRSYGWSGSSYYDNLMPGKWGKTGITEIEDANQPNSGILVVMDQWKPPAAFYSKMELGLVHFSEVHFVGKADADKLDRSRWRDFEDVFQERLQREMGTVQGLGAQLAVEQAFHHNYARLFRGRTFSYRNKRQENSAFAKLEAIFRTYVQPIKADHRKYGPFVDVALPKGVDPTKLVEQFAKQAPRAERLLQLMNFQITEDDDLDFFLDTL